MEIMFPKGHYRKNGIVKRFAFTDGKNQDCEEKGINNKRTNSAAKGKISNNQPPKVKAGLKRDFWQ